MKSHSRKGSSGKSSKLQELLKLTPEKKCLQATNYGSVTKHKKKHLRNAQAIDKESADNPETAELLRKSLQVNSKLNKILSQIIFQKKENVK